MSGDTGFVPEVWARLQQQLEVGQDGENIVAMDLTKLGYSVEQSVGFHKPDDMSATTKTGRVTTFEVKLDKLAHKTKRVGIEISQCGKPGAIYTTKADYFVWVLEGLHEIWYFTTQDVKSFVTNELYCMERETVQSKYYLIDLEVIRPYVKLIRNIK